MQWIEHGKKWRDDDRKRTLELKPGMVLELSDGRKLLVGHVNTMNGGCDHCPDLSSDDVIARWCMLLPGAADW